MNIISIVAKKCMQVNKKHETKKINLNYKFPNL